MVSRQPTYSFQIWNLVFISNFSSLSFRFSCFFDNRCGLDNVTEGLYSVQKCSKEEEKSDPGHEYEEADVNKIHIFSSSAMINQSNKGQ